MLLLKCCKMRKEMYTYFSMLRSKKTNLVKKSDIEAQAAAFTKWESAGDYFKWHIQVNPVRF